MDDQRIGHLVTVAAILAAPVATTFFGLTASVSPASINETGTTATMVSSGSATCTPSGGTPPYTYSWQPDDNIDGLYAIAPTSSSTQFKKTSTLSGESYFGSFLCVVTDALGATAKSGDCSVSLTRS